MIKTYLLKAAALATAFLLTAPLTAAAQDNTLADEFALEQIQGSQGERGERNRRRATSQQVLIPAGLLFASFDTDADYAASEAELTVGIKRSYAAADSNANGRLSLVELASWRERVLGSRDLLPGNTQFDKNFDSQVNAKEFETVLTGLFRRFDDNENGQLEFAELTRNARSARGGETGQRRERPQGGQQRGQRPQRGQRR